MQSLDLSTGFDLYVNYSLNFQPSRLYMYMYIYVLVVINLNCKKRMLGLSVSIGQFLSNELIKVELPP